MRHDRHIPVHAIERFDHLSRRRDVGDQEQHVGTGLLQTRELWNDVNIVGLEFFDASIGDILCRKRRLQPLLVQFAQGLLISINPGFLVEYFFTA